MPPVESSGASAPSSLLDIAGRAEARVRTLLDAERVRWSAVDPDLGDLIDCLAGLVDAGGKRLRPAFCHWAYVGAGGDGDDSMVVDVGAAFELLYAFALVHDDVMDGSDQRRGRPTAHVTFASRHQEAGWRGEPRRFGEGVAILVGDLAFVYADILIAAAPPAARAVYDELRIGQYLDVVGAVRGQVKPGHRPPHRLLQVGQVHRGATPARGRRPGRAPRRPGRAPVVLRPAPRGGLPAARRPVGRLRRRSRYGQAGGRRLREGKPTPLMAIATQRATGAGTRCLERTGDPALTEAEVGEVQEVLVATGARDEIERAIERLTAEAVEAVEAIKGTPLTEEAKVALTELAAYVAWRDR